MKPSNLIKALRLAFLNRFAVLLVGQPGVGKSEIVSQTACELGMDLVISHPVVSDPTDYKGMPFVVEGRAEFLPFGELRRIVEATNPTVFFLDDLGQASPAVQAAAMHLLLARCVGGTRISDQVTFVAATNRRQDKAGVQGILEPVKSRFVSILHLEPDVEDWCAWAVRNNMPSELISFIRFKPDMLAAFTPSRDMVNSPSPRTVEAVGRLLNAGIPEELSFEMIAGAAGSAFATEFTAFLRIFDRLPDVESILTSPRSAPVPEEPSVLYALCGAISVRANEENFPGIITYADRLHPEFSVLLVRECVSRRNELADTNSFSRWAAEHSEVLV
ncbi:MAG: ATP-binding protein [Desulfovibrionales bacterium]